MKKNKWLFICFMIASICYFVVSVIKLVHKDNTGAIIYLCLGASFLCLSTTHLNKKDKTEDEKDKTEDE